MVYGQDEQDEQDEQDKNGQAIWYILFILSDFRSVGRC